MDQDTGCADGEKRSDSGYISKIKPKKKKSKEFAERLDAEHERRIGLVSTTV